MTSTKKTVAVSGGFSIIHPGHVRLIKEAALLGDHLLIIVNNDNWLMSKQGYVAMNEEDRMEVVRGLAGENATVVLTEHAPNDPDRSVCRELRKYRPDIFANGGDRTKETTPEDKVCTELGIEQRYGVGAGGKVQSSSWIARGVKEGLIRSVRPWGHFNSLDKGDGWYLKTIVVKPGGQLSLQYHHHRSEYWMLVEGQATATRGDSVDTLVRTELKPTEIFHIPCGAIHRLESEKGGTIVEVAYGDFDENDIVRLEDIYGRTATDK